METVTETVTETVIVPNVVKMVDPTNGYVTTYNENDIKGLVKTRTEFAAYKTRLEGILRHSYSEYSDAVAHIAEEMDIDLTTRKQVTVTITANLWIRTMNADLDTYDVENDLEVSANISTYSDEFDVDEYETEVEVTDIWDI